MADMKNKLTAMTAGIVLAVVMIAFIGGIMPAWRDQGDDIRNNPCETAGGFWNTTDHDCQVSSTNETVITNFTHYALSTQFYGRNGGSSFIVVLGAILIGMVIWWIRRGN